MNAREFLIGAQTSFPFQVLSGEGLDREISVREPAVQDGSDPGFWPGVKEGQVAIAGPTAPGVTLPPAFPASCLIITGPCPQSLLITARAEKIPLVASGMEKGLLMSRVAGLIREKLDRTVYVHASMVVYRGAGVLIRGESGSGKSFCCLELLRDGASLIADDLVEVRRQGQRLVGMCPPAIKGLIEIKGLGICSAAALFGSSIVLERAEIDCAFELAGAPSRGVYRLMGVEVPLETIPAFSGGRVAEIVKEILLHR